MQAFLGNAEFLCGARSPAQFPPDVGGEVAFAGRSNAGKSSALNALTGHKGLARTSKQPGRTREINFFSLNERSRLVDLPGYGYARVPEAIQKQWAAALERYIAGRQSLAGIVVIMDVRHPLTAADRQMLALAAHRRIPTHILLTKADKLSRGRAKTTLEQVSRELAEHEEMTAQLFSALKRSGVEDLRGRLISWLVEPS